MPRILLSLPLHHRLLASPARRSWINFLEHARRRANHVMRALNVPPYAGHKYYSRRLEPPDAWHSNIHTGPRSHGTDGAYRRPSPRPRPQLSSRWSSAPTALFYRQPSRPSPPASPPPPRLREGQAVAGAWKCGRHAWLGRGLLCSQHVTVSCCTASSSSMSPSVEPPARSAPSAAVLLPPAACRAASSPDVDADDCVTEKDIADCLSPVCTQHVVFTVKKYSACVSVCLFVCLLHNRFSFEYKVR